MGRSYVFECPKCTFKATVSGGADSGLDCSVETISCRDCRRLYDAVTRLRVPAKNNGLNNGGIRLGRAVESPPVFDQLVGQLPFQASAPFQWTEFPLRCPVSHRHNVQRWTDPGKCPVCGSFLEKAGLPFRLWG